MSGESEPPARDFLTTGCAATRGTPGDELAGDAAFGRELQDFTRARLSQHEYPRLVAFVPDLPKTPAGKVNRRILHFMASAD